MDIEQPLKKSNYIQLLLGNICRFKTYLGEIVDILLPLSPILFTLRNNILIELALHGNLFGTYFWIISSIR